MYYLGLEILVAHPFERQVFPYGGSCARHIRLSGKYFLSGRRVEDNTTLVGLNKLLVLAVAAEWMDRFKFKLTHGHACMCVSTQAYMAMALAFCAILTPTSTSLLINYRAILIQQ